MSRARIDPGSSWSNTGRFPPVLASFKIGARREMTGKIYLLDEDASLRAMVETPYEAESLLQSLLSEHPDLLAGDQIRPSSPRRWLLVSRELAVPDEVGVGGRWALDHLFIDQDGIPTLVEVKRSTNSQIRREVVGQMLDYAANGTIYWSPEQVTAAYERRCEREGIDAEALLGEFVGPDGDPETFWQTVKTNLQAGRVRLMFVADEIPRELRRIIEFLNEQMDPAEVIGVEVKQFEGSGRVALVPRVVGQTVEAEQRKSVRESTSWDVSSFMKRMAEQRPEHEVQAAQRLLEWAERQNLQIKWGRGVKNGSFTPKAVDGGATHNMFSVYTDSTIQLQFSAMKEPPFAALEMRRSLADRLEGVSPQVKLPDEKLSEWPVIRLGWFADREALDRFIQAWQWFLDSIRDLEPAEGDSVGPER